MTFEDPQDRLIAYAEGMLTGDERSAFERDLATSPALRRQLQLLQQVDVSLSRQFAPPTQLILDLNPAQPDATRAFAPWKRWAGLAGAAVAAAIVLVFGLQFAGDRLSRPTPFVLTLTGYYQSFVSSGFNPDHVCTDDADFIDYSRRTIGLPLLGQSDARVQIVGWVGYGSMLQELGLSPRGKGILARVDGTPVMILIDYTDSATKPKLDPKAAEKKKLNLFQRQLGELTLYELTPLNSAVASERFSLQP